MTLSAARRYTEATRDANLLFFEQPLGHADLKGFATLTRAASIPIGVDEGIHGIADIEAHARAGAGGVVLVRGQSGVGKTRLAVELATMASADGMRVVTAECSPGTGSSGQRQSRVAPLAVPAMT